MLDIPLKSAYVLCTRKFCKQIRDEIVTSEQTYVKELRTLVMVFLRPLERWVAEGMSGLALTTGESHTMP